MAGGLHGSARTTPRVRAELQASKEKTNALAERYGLSRTTVTKWRARTSTADAPMGPRSPRSTVLTLIEEAMIVEFRRRTLLPLDDVMGCLKDSIPNLTRSSLHRCLGRHGISRLPDSQEKASKRGKFAETTIGYVHLDHCELRLTDGKLHMFLAIDRVSKFTYVEFHDRTKMLNGAAFLHSVIEAFPYRIHTVLTDNGTAFADLPKNRSGIFASGGRTYSIAPALHTASSTSSPSRITLGRTAKPSHEPDDQDATTGPPLPGSPKLEGSRPRIRRRLQVPKHLKALRWRHGISPLSGLGERTINLQSPPPSYFTYTCTPGTKDLQARPRHPLSFVVRRRLLEDLGEPVGRDAGAGVGGDRDRHEPSRAARITADRGEGVLIRHPQGESPLAVHGVAGVHRDVDERSLELAGIRLDEACVALHSVTSSIRGPKTVRSIR